MAISQMSGRERLIAALNSEETDRLPFAPLIDNYFVSSLGEQNRRKSLIAACKYIGCDIMERHVFNPTPKINNLKTSLSKSDNKIITYYETPVGTLTQEETISGNTKYISKYPVTTLSDIKIFQYICENTTYKPNTALFKIRDKMLGDKGLATLSGNLSPVQELLQFKCGVENTVYLLADYPDEIEELFAVMNERNLKQYEALLKYPCDYIFDYEDTSTTVMSPWMFEDYSLPAINLYADTVHKAGKKFITHMCGKLTGFGDIISQGRQDCIDSVCPPDTGDVEPWNAKNLLGENKVIIGGINPPSLVFMDKRQSAQRAAEIIKNVKNKRGFILSTGDAVPYGAPIDNLKAIADLIKKLGEASLGNEVSEDIIESVL